MYYFTFYKKIILQNTQWIKKILFLIIIPILYSFFYNYIFGRYGFNPTDQGFILGGTWLLLHGSIPHTDFISIHPVFSYVIHICDYIFLSKLYFVSGIISLYEIFLYSYLLIKLFCKTNLILSSCLALIALNVNIHTFPVMAWHTIDGLLIITLSIYLEYISSKKKSKLILILSPLLLGLSLLIKQSFFPIFFLCNVSYHFLSKHKEAFLKNLLALCPFMLYILSISTISFYKRKVIPNIIEQLFSGRFVYGENFFKNILFHQNFYSLFLLVSSILLTLIYRKYSYSYLTYFFLLIDGIYIVSILVLYKMKMPGIGLDWSSILLLLFAVRFLIENQSSKIDLLYGIYLFTIAFSITLSWGYESSAFLSGIYIMIYLSKYFHNLHFNKINIIALISFALIIINLITSFSRDTLYRDSIRKDAFYNLGILSKQLSYIKTNKTTYSYLEKEQQCIISLPSRYIYIYNNNVFAYFAFNLIDITPNLWWIKPEEGKIPINNFLKVFRNRIYSNDSTKIVLIERNNVKQLPNIQSSDNLNKEKALLEFLNENNFRQINSERCNPYFMVQVKDL